MSDLEHAGLLRAIAARCATATPLTREDIEAALSREYGYKITLGDPEDGEYRTAFVHLPRPIKTITIEGLCTVDEETP